MSFFSSSSARRIVSSTVAAAMFATAGCSSDSVTAPTPQTPSNGLISGLLGLVSQLLTPVTGLLRPQALSEPIVRSITVDANGGVLRIAETGLKITIPENAVSSRTTITVTALPGHAVAYEFKPHGLVFKRPIQFTHDLPLLSLDQLSSLRGAYFKDVSQVNLTTGAAMVNEELPARILSGKVTFDISHFSGYMVSTGRSKTTRTSASE